MTTAERTAVQTRILIVDDHELIRFGLARAIESQPGWSLVGEASETAEALQIVRRERPELAIVDLRLQQGDGLELVRQIGTSSPETKVLVYSMHDEQLYADRCLRAGAAGFVGKQEPADALLIAIRRVLDGGRYLSPAMTDRILGQSSGRSPANQSPLDSLSDREMEVYELIGAGLSVKEIARHLHLSPKTIEYHRQHIKEKLQLPSSAALARHATAHALDRN